MINDDFVQALSGNFVTARGSGVPVYDTIFLDGGWNTGDIIAAINAGDVMEIAAPPDKRSRYTKVLLEDGRSGFVSLSEVRKKNTRTAEPLITTRSIQLYYRTSSRIRRTLIGMGRVTEAIPEGDTIINTGFTERGFTLVQHGSTYGWVEKSTLKDYTITDEALIAQAAAEAAALEERYYVKSNVVLYKTPTAAIEMNGALGLLSRLLKAHEGEDIKTLEKGTLVMKTGETYWDGDIIEVTHDGDLGWIWNKRVRTASAAEAAAAPPAVPVRPIMATAPDGAYIDERPSAASTSIARIPNRATVRIISRSQEKWVFVEYEGIRGYVQRQKLTEIEQSAPAAPAPVAAQPTAPARPAAQPATQTTQTATSTSTQTTQTAQPTLRPAGSKGTVTADVNLYEEPSTTSRVKRVLPKGTTTNDFTDMEGEYRGWAVIGLGDDFGFVRSEFIEQNK